MWRCWWCYNGGDENNTVVVSKKIAILWCWWPCGWSVHDGYDNQCGDGVHDYYKHYTKVLIIWFNVDNMLVVMVVAMMIDGACGEAVCQHND